MAEKTDSKVGGAPFRDCIQSYIAETFDGELEVYSEVYLGRTIVGRKRRADILVLQPKSGKALALEAKYQAEKGTTDQKMPYSIQDCIAMPVPAFIVWGGPGWSDGVKGLLRASGRAVEVRIESSQSPIKLVESTELDAVLAVHFGLWPRLLEKQGKKKVAA